MSVETCEWISEVTEALPFNVNPRGVLVHRVREGFTIFYGKKYSHEAVHYWCGNQTNGEGVDLAAVPPADRLLCEKCELAAVAAGERPTDEIAGRHVHRGVVKVHRTCCRKSDRRRR